MQVVNPLGCVTLLNLGSSRGNCNAFQSFQYGSHVILAKKLLENRAQMNENLVVTRELDSACSSCDVVRMRLNCTLSLDRQFGIMRCFGDWYNTFVSDFFITRQISLHFSSFSGDRRDRSIFEGDASVSEALDTLWAEAETTHTGSRFQTLLRYKLLYQPGQPTWTGPLLMRVPIDAHTNSLWSISVGITTSQHIGAWYASSDTSYKIEDLVGLCPLIPKP